MNAASTTSTPYLPLFGTPVLVKFTLQTVSVFRIHAAKKTAISDVR